MIKHFIILSSSYSTGKRIAIHYVIDKHMNSEILNKIIKTIKDKCGQTVSISTHYIETDSREWISIIEKDGFFDWCTLPDNSDAWSDFGLDPLLELLPELEEAETAETKIVVINKILDVNHQRGDLCSGFIEGGKYTLSEISN